MSTKIHPKTTAQFRVRGPSIGIVTIHETTYFHHFSMQDGSVQIMAGRKAYHIQPGEPVTLDDSGFTLARTGERLVSL